MTIKRRGARNNLGDGDGDGDGIIKERNVSSTVRVVECSWGLFTEKLKSPLAHAVAQSPNHCPARGSRMNGCKVHLSPTDMQRKSHAMHHPNLDGGRADWINPFILLSSVCSVHHLSFTTPHLPQSRKTEYQRHKPRNEEQRARSDHLSHW